MPDQTPPVLRLVFAQKGPGPTLTIGPFREVRIEGEALRAERGGKVLAQHLPHSWMVDGREFFRVDCETPVRLHFESETGESSPVTQPFMHFSCADGIAYGDGIIVGNVDLETKCWYSHVHRRYWRELVVKSASAPAA